ncbi:BQ5605_C008g05191 [Microbotryum silenes-dioicae]|uniref:BQ5605_C008g05191 protein n=1 Tax=Microbotryum silenes-dioicae TaxID=796604 RepID=A0A2X0MH30_9BASI|nr:BQ5605_C008g05191 [Microbotryum silenes-dioicae]
MTLTSTAPRIAFLGPLGTYSHQATTDFFGNDCKLAPQERIIDVFSNVASTSASFGVVPIENSSIGIVHETMQALRTTELSVRGMIGLKVGHALLSRPFANDEDSKSRNLSGDEEKRKRYKRVYSHEQGIGQCVSYLQTNYPRAQIIPVNSTALAAQKVLQDPPEESLAICSIKCAEVYGLRVVDRDIQDGGSANTTRFIVLSLGSTPLPEPYPIAPHLRGYTGDAKP